MQGIGNIPFEDCSCEGCAKCGDGKRPNYLILNLANFQDEERYVATFCDPDDGCADDLDSRACGVYSPTSNFNGAHQVNWVSTMPGATVSCIHTYETTGSHTAGDFCFGPYTCSDCIEPLAATDYFGNPQWLYGLKYRFRVVVEELGGGLCDRYVYTINEDGSNSQLIIQEFGISSDWFCEDGIVDDVTSFSNGEFNPIEMLFNDDGDFYWSGSTGPELRAYQTNAIDAECGTVGSAPTITIESSVGRTTA